MAKDFSLKDLLCAVIKADGTYAGAPCLSWEEAIELSNQYEGSKIFFLEYDGSQDEDDNELSVIDDVEPFDIDDDYGFDPYLGEYTYDC